MYVNYTAWGSSCLKRIKLTFSQRTINVTVLRSIKTCMIYDCIFAYYDRNKQPQYSNNI